MICSHCGHIIKIGEWCYCPHDRVTPLPHHPVLPSERTVILQHPGTGEVRIPGRSDRLSRSEARYQSLGFERREISTGREMIGLEKRTGLIHESSNYNRSGRAERDTGSH